MKSQEVAFAFDDVRVRPDCQIGLHSHPQWEVSHVIRGGGTREIGDRSEPMTEGEVIVIPPHIAHVWRFDPEVTDQDGCIANISVFFEMSTIEGLAALLPELRESVRRLRSLSDAISFTGKTRSELTRILYSMRMVSPETRLPGMIRLLSMLASTEGRPAGSGIHLSRNEIRLEKIRTFCACNYAREIRLDEISLYVGMNKSAFCSFMKRHTGQTFSEFVNTHRLERAVELLRSSDDTISDIAFAVGFQNVTYFNRLFRARYGLTPRAARLAASGTESPLIR